MSFSIFTTICNQHQSIFKHFHHLKKLLLLVWIFYMNWIYVIFCAWFLPLSMVFSKLIQVAAYISTLFLFYWIISHCIDKLHYIDLLIKWWTFGFFPFFLATLKCASINIYGHVFIQICCHFSWVYIYILHLIISRSAKLFFQSGCTILHLQKQCTRAANFSTFSPTPVITTFF